MFLLSFMQSIFLFTNQTDKISYIKPIIGGNFSRVQSSIYVNFTGSFQTNKLVSNCNSCQLQTRLALYFKKNITEIIKFLYFYETRLFKA